MTYRVRYLNAARITEVARVPVPRYAAGSHFESCPAATGEPVPSSECRDFPDGAHRCRLDRRPVHHRHSCTCDFSWISLSAVDLDDAAIMAALYPARHSA